MAELDQEKIPCKCRKSKYNFFSFDFYGVALFEIVLTESNYKPLMTKMVIMVQMEI